MWEKIRTSLSWQAAASMWTARKIPSTTESTAFSSPKMRECAMRKSTSASAMAPANASSIRRLISRWQKAATWRWIPCRSKEWTPPNGKPQPFCKGMLIIREKIMTHGEQRAETYFKVDLDGADSSADLVSRSVAKGNSYQYFRSIINGNNRCAGHSECDAIIMEKGVVSAVPELTANDIDAQLIHEAAIGKIAGEQLIKLMSLGLTSEEAEAKIVEGFLK